MSDHHKKPGPPGDILAHHGIKGMKWGVRKEEDSSPSTGKVGPIDAANHNARTKAYMAASQSMENEAKKQTPAQVSANLAENQKKFDAKFHDGPAPKDSSSGRVTTAPGKPKSGSGIKGKWDNLTPDQKTLAIEVGIAGVGIAGLALLGAKNKKAILSMAGKPIDNSQFNSNVMHSQLKSWGLKGYVQKSSYLRPEYELPAGHTFYRLTTSSETGFREATYATHSMEDAKRYIANFRHEKGGGDINFVRFTNTEPTKVPNLTTVLDTLREHMVETTATGSVKDREVLAAYQSMSGGSWDNPTALGLISKLKKKGYGALVDEMDAGVIGETPVVFFGHETATPKEVAPLTKKLIDAAEGSLIEIPKPPGRKL